MSVTPNVALRAFVESIGINLATMERCMKAGDVQTAAQALHSIRQLQQRAMVAIDAISRKNQINTIMPYKWNGMWVFDDKEVGLCKEALVAGMPEMIEYATRQASITNPDDGFLVKFSKDPFKTEGYGMVLDWAREESGGNVYRWGDTGFEGWLCPALFRYFDEAPERMYIDVTEVGA